MTMWCAQLQTNMLHLYHIKPRFLYHFTTFLKLDNLHLHNYKAEPLLSMQMLCSCWIRYNLLSCSNSWKSPTPNVMSFQNSKLAASWKEVLKLCTLLLIAVKHFSEISDNVLQKQPLQILLCFNYLCFPCRELTQVSVQFCRDQYQVEDWRYFSL
jgi:hypothetical protein